MACVNLPFLRRRLCSSLRCTPAATGAAPPPAIINEQLTHNTRADNVRSPTFKNILRPTANHVHLQFSWEISSQIVISPKKEGGGVLSCCCLLRASFSSRITVPTPTPQLEVPPNPLYWNTCASAGTTIQFPSTRRKGKEAKRRQSAVVVLLWAPQKTHGSALSGTPSIKTVFSKLSLQVPVRQRSETGHVSAGQIGVVGS